mgnify:CR=1 FL=1
MSAEKNLPAGSTAMLLMKLLEREDMYGYQMIEELRRRSDHTFDLKAGTLYPLLHTLEQKGYITAWEEQAAGRPRRYYHLTDQGKKQLRRQEEDWRGYARGVTLVLEGGAGLA